VSLSLFRSLSTAPNSENFRINITFLAGAGCVSRQCIEDAADEMIKNLADDVTLRAALEDTTFVSSVSSEVRTGLGDWG
jgi:hypothetical protein